MIVMTDGGIHARPSLWFDYQKICCNLYFFKGCSSGIGTWQVFVYTMPVAVLRSEGLQG